MHDFDHKVVTGNQHFSAFMVNVVLFTATTFMVIFFFLFYHLRKSWVLMILNCFNISGIICLFMETMNKSLNMSDWLFGIFCVFHYGSFLLLIYLNYQKRYLYFCHSRVLNCLDMMETRHVNRCNCLFCDNCQRREAPTDMVATYHRWQTPSEAGEDLDQTKADRITRLRMYFANEMNIAPAVSSLTGSLSFPTRIIPDDDFPVEKVYPYRPRCSSAPHLQNIHYTMYPSEAAGPNIIVCQAEVHEEPRPRLAEQNFLNISNEIVNVEEGGNWVAMNRYNNEDEDEIRSVHSSSDGSFDALFLHFNVMNGHVEDDIVENGLPSTSDEETEESNHSNDQEEEDAEPEEVFHYDLPDPEEDEQALLPNQVVVEPLIGMLQNGIDSSSLEEDEDSYSDE